MLDAILRIIDRVIALRHYQTERLQKQFDLLVIPTMADLEHIQTDYLKFFIEGRDRFVSRQLNLPQLVQFFENRRTEFEPMRQKVTALGQGLTGGNLFPCVDEFSRALVRYLPRGDLYERNNGSAATSLLHELQKLSGGQNLSHDSYEDRPIWGDDPVACIDWFIQEQKEKFYEVVEAAAKVRAAVATAD